MHIKIVEYNKITYYYFLRLFLNKTKMNIFNDKVYQSQGENDYYF